MPRHPALEEYKRAYEDLVQFNNKFVDKISEISDVLDDTDLKERLHKALLHFEEIDTQMAADDNIFARLATVGPEEKAQLGDLYKKE